MQTGKLRNHQMLGPSEAGAFKCFPALARAASGVSRDGLPQGSIGEEERHCRHQVYRLQGNEHVTSFWKRPPATRAMHSPVDQHEDSALRP